jgi:23S rRNA (guanine2445-N2)-methyltransferase / 23S rRNA (guanine2069-N7)-methyltransferase
VRADCRQWLQDCRECYDLIFLDPPSFSNSSRMEGTLDIQRDHAELIRDSMRLLAPGGTLMFSTNLRRFRLDPSLAETFDVEDRTAWSIPKDFQRNQRIHQCWFLRPRA